MSKLKIGIIGLGTIALKHTAACLKLADEVELYAVVDVSEERLNSFADQYGVKHRFTDYRDMLKLEELDAVIVCVWNCMHAEVTIDALNAGKHVLCEKPMATKVEDALRMREVAEQNGKKLMIGFVRRYGRDAKVLKDFVDNEYLGEVYYAKMKFLRRNGNPGGWFGNKALSGGGPLIDLGVHMIDMARFLMGNPKPVSAYGATFRKIGARGHLKSDIKYSSVSRSKNDICDVEDMATALIRFDNGAVISLESSFTLNLRDDEYKIELFGTKGGATCDPALTIYNETNGYLTNVSFDDSFVEELRDFAAIIREGRTSNVNDGIDVMRIVDAIYRSAEIGHEVLIDD